MYNFDIIDFPTCGCMLFDVGFSNIIVHSELFSEYDFRNKVGFFYKMAEKILDIHILIKWENTSIEQYFHIINNMSLFGLWHVCLNYKHITDVDLIFSFSDYRDAIIFKLKTSF